MKNAVFWDIKTQFVPHRRHITSPLQTLADYCCVIFDVSTVVTMKNVVHWDVILFLSSVLQLLATANPVPISLILFARMMEAICSVKTSVLPGAARPHNLSSGREGGLHPGSASKYVAKTFGPSCTQEYQVSASSCKVRKWRRSSAEWWDAESASHLLLAVQRNSFSGLAKTWRDCASRPHGLALNTGYMSHTR
jgi:hypothetical protein